MKELTLYKVQTAVNATLGKNVVMENTGPEHARIIMSNIFRTAKKYVYIFAGNLNGDVSKGEYLTELENFINKGGIVRVILEYLPARKSQAVPLILGYQKKFPKNISIHVAAPKALESIRNPKGGINHFTIADDRMHRLEQPEKKDTPWRYIAIANFNDSFTVSKLKTIFEMLGKSAHNFDWQAIVGSGEVQQLSLYQKIKNFIFGK